MFVCALISIIIIFGFVFVMRHKFYNKKIGIAIKNKDYEKADVLLFAKNLFLGHLFVSMKYYNLKIELEFRKGELFKKNFDKSYNEILNKKIFTNKILLYLSLNELVNNNIDMSVKIINKCINIDLDYEIKEYVNLIFMFVNNDFNNFLVKYQTIFFKDNDLQVIFTYLAKKVNKYAEEKLIIDYSLLPQSNYSYLLGEIK